MLPCSRKCLLEMKKNFCAVCDWDMALHASTKFSVISTKTLLRGGCIYHLVFNFFQCSINALIKSTNIGVLVNPAANISGYVRDSAVQFGLLLRGQRKVGIKTHSITSFLSSPTVKSALQYTFSYIM